ILNFVGGTHTLTADSQLTGPGTLGVGLGLPGFGGGGVVNVFGTYGVGDTSITHSGTVNFNHDVTLPTLTLTTAGGLGGSGNVTVDGLLTWAHGTMNGTGRTVAKGGIALGTDVLNGNPTLSGRTLDNYGTAVLGNLGLNAANGAVWNNLEG